jgi:hypothetical protein
MLAASSAVRAGDVLYDVPPVLAALDTSRDVEALSDDGLAEIRGMQSGLSCEQTKLLLYYLLLSMMGYEPPECPPCPGCGDLVNGFAYTYWGAQGLVPIADGYWSCADGECTHMTEPPFKF